MPGRSCPLAWQYDIISHALYYIRKKAQERSPRMFSIAGFFSCPYDFPAGWKRTAVKVWKAVPCSRRRYDDGHFPGVMCADVRGRGGRVDCLVFPSCLAGV